MWKKKSRGVKVEKVCGFVMSDVIDINHFSMSVIVSSSNLGKKREKYEAMAEEMKKVRKRKKKRKINKSRNHREFSGTLSFYVW